MKKIKVICVLLLTAALLLSGCGAGNKSNYGKVVAATYGDRTIYLDEANFWLRAQELDYSYLISIYNQLYGVDAAGFWAGDSGRRAQTYAESMKEDIMAEFRQINILLDHAAEYNAELTADEMAKIDKSMADMKANYSNHLFSESVIGNYSDDALKQSLINRTKALKVWDAVRNQAQTTVTDEECKSFTVRFFRFDDSANVKDGDNTVTGAAIADLLENAMKDGKSFDDLKSSYNSLYYSTESFRYRDSDNTTALYKECRDLTKGQFKQFTDTSGESPIHYVAECVSEDDKAAAANIRQELESVQKEDYFEKIFAEWQKAAKPFSVKSAFSSLPVPDNK